MKKGISVIICCYNSESRLPKTLAALSLQLFKEPINWEIVLVDNASTDHTSIDGPRIWALNNNGVPFRIEYESAPGLSYARKKGIQSANYPILVFCDDDNWLGPNYLQNVYSIFEKNPSIAACGGKGLPAFEQNPPPYWFNEYSEAFALGSQEITREKGRLLNLYGAGLAIKKDVLSKLFDSGFEPILSDRVGTALSSAGDTELTNALVLRGFELYYSEALIFSHFMPSARLTKDYLNRLFTSFGTDGPIRNLYYSYLSQRFFH
ncbi:MAG: glycosyltransferase, partial [Chitinophagaceae bacterium]